MQEFIKIPSKHSREVKDKKFFAHYPEEWILL